MPCFDRNLPYSTEVCGGHGTQLTFKQSWQRLYGGHRAYTSAFDQIRGRASMSSMLLLWQCYLEKEMLLKSGFDEN